MRLLLVDNYDSFVYNLYQELGSLGVDVEVCRNDELPIEALGVYDGFVISPGPGDPRDGRWTGIGPYIIGRLGSEKPVLGVCLGHQEIIHVFGGKIRKARVVRHGEKSPIVNLGGVLFRGLPRRFYVGRYHSLVGEVGSGVPLRVNAVSADDGEIMGVEHVSHPIFGVQFHPESVLTRLGQNILESFIGVVKR
ncbi:aminodeoxychorismate/anthranilate synthase component II [Candidatus Marsarchaeota G2 archaeon OSP_D]|uniref:anthranilate synthase n=4 Tax=Candidatus Marsarchaeota group 2 TaxID=2203771 RepID=A0A2R6C7F4_9ARCH|nr:MAG: aminodeoxychorismate/anthranilate synthase component II [Candidatus Marsarchaeota G2 archaeon OSP_D]PSN92916.1 MAG: aminodeoxychorismate/anthranilate synthase component II [Candidatus Marsarchaeota G2 archaeon ECH_B_SAG-M15]PSN94423.1 MAG: aminodeoxychorismate/anthranilate synthase component II [Candidatus Marsarchaeota G2 archaeon ECH_B_SAG-C16]PSO06842.1 MAG: aminodeoxychorismate/anthranilate synthase component II [Candidatus Marsarchaeota G2 archaeon BE_D]